MKTKFPWILLLCAIAYIVFLQECRSPGTVDPVIIHDTIPGDPEIVKIEIEKPVPFEVKLPPDTFYFPTEVDTAKILAEYFKIAPDYYANKIFKEVLKDDTSAFVGIDFRLNKNDIFDLKLNFQNRRPIAINTTISEKRFKLFAGINLGGNKEVFGIGPSIFALSKKENLYGIDIDLINKTYEFSMLWKISFRKQKPP